MRILKSFSLFIFMVLLASCSQKTTTPTTQNSTVVNPQADQREGGRKKGGKKERPQFADLLTKMDVNKDGKLDISETDGRLKETFTTIDINNDGFITEEEFNNAPRPQRPRGGRN